MLYTPYQIFVKLQRFHTLMPSYVEQIDIVLSFFTGYYDQGLYFDNTRLIGLCQYINIASEFCLYTSFLVE